MGPFLPVDMSIASATTHRDRVAAAAAGILFLSVAMYQRVAGAAPAPCAHHVVGGDPGWDVGSQVLAWSADRHFAVGDSLWFAYEAADDGVVEVGGEAEFASCEVGNPIRMYTGGLSRVVLDGGRVEVGGEAEFASCEVGNPIRMYTGGLSRVVLDGGRARYFVSPDPAKCMSGLKLRVAVRVEEDAAAATAPAPAASSSTQGAAVVVPPMRDVICFVSVWWFLFLVLGA